MILDLEALTPQNRYIPDVQGFQFLQLMADPISKTGVRTVTSVGPSLSGLARFAALGAYSPMATLENLTTGDNSSFKVGDQYRIMVSGGPPNADISGNFAFRGMPAPYSGQQDLSMSAWLGSFYGSPYPAIGKADAAGNYVTSGVFSPSQAGKWSQIWESGGNWASPGPGFDSGTYHFEVLNSDGSHYSDTPNVLPGGTAYYTQASNQVPTQPAPAAVVQTLAQQLAARGDTLSPSGQLVAAVQSKPNQSLPPATALTVIPTLPAGSSTAAQLTTSYGGGTPPAAPPATSQLIPGLSNTSLLIAAAVGIGVLMAVKK